MIDQKYLRLGLCGLARAHTVNAMVGHLGAAVVAGYFIGEEMPELDEQVFASIEKKLDCILRGGERIWYNPEKTGISIPELFEPFSDGSAVPVEIAPISTALANNISSLHESGHNVIFSSIAIRALHDHSQFATDSIVGGIEKLIAMFNNLGPGSGYYGKDRGRIPGNMVVLDDQCDFPPYRDQQEMVEVVIDELIRSGAVRKQGFGGLFHIINHAAALTELLRFGYKKLARQGLASHHHHLRLWRSLPDVEQELGPLKAAKHDPWTPEFWQDADSHQWSAHLTHRIKTMYGLSRLLRFIESDEKRKQAEAKFRYLMA